MRLFHLSILIFYSLVLPFFTFQIFASDFYKWTDEKGTTHFSDSLSGIPNRYRDQVQGGDFKKKNPSLPPLKRSPEIFSDILQDGEPLEKQEKSLKKFTIPYKSNEGSARRVIIEVTFNDRITVPMLFDTGAPETVIFPDLAVKLGVLDRDHPKTLTLAAGIGGSTPAALTIFDSMSVGDFKSDFVPTRVIDGFSKEYDGIIGLDFISDYSVRIDPKEKVVVFKEILHDRQLYGGHNETWWRNNFIKFEFHRIHWKRWRDHIEKVLKRNSLASVTVRGPLCQDRCRLFLKSCV